MGRPTKKERIRLAELDREAAKECVVLTACYMFQDLPSANLESLRRYVERYQEANKKFEKLMGGHFQ